MQASRLSAAQSIHLLQQAACGAQAIGVWCGEHGIRAQPFDRWRQKFGGMTVPAAQRLRALAKEHARLKRLLAERDLEVNALEGGPGKTSVTVAARRGAVQLLVARGLAQRRACVLLPLPRSTLGDQARPDRHAAVATQVDELAQRHPR